jgi:5-methyltetrahydropteroyltriglutamate--homocysteine methyltransferase
MEDEVFIHAMDVASEPARRKGVDVQIHLHAPIEYKKVCHTRNINVIGVESAANPQYLDIIDRKDLEQNDKTLRVGVARTDISRMASEYNDKYDSDVWRNQDEMMTMINALETPENIAARLKKAYAVFGDLVTYTGPDCGMGSWPSQKAAFALLRNTSKGIDKFRSE